MNNQNGHRFTAREPLLIASMNLGGHVYCTRDAHAAHTSAQSLSDWRKRTQWPCVKVSASRAGGSRSFLAFLDRVIPTTKNIIPVAAPPQFDSRFCRGSFPRSSHISVFKTGIRLLPCQVPGVTRLALGLVGPESVYFNFYLNVAARTIVSAEPSLRYSSMFLGH